MRRTDVESTNASSSPREKATRKRKHEPVQVESIKSSKRARNAAVYTEVSEHEEIDDTKVQKSGKKLVRASGIKARRASRAQDKEVVAEAAKSGPSRTPTKTKRRKPQIVDKAGEEVEDKIKAEIEVDEEVKEVVEVKVKIKRKRKTKEEKEAEAMPLAARTVGSQVLIGAHVSSAGGVHNAIINSVHIGGNALALFLKSQRKWENPPLQDEHLAGFLSNCKAHKYSHHDHLIPPIVPHGSYLVNLAHPDPVRTKQAYDAFLDDLQRCTKLGIRLYNFHPGSCGASKSRSHAITQLAKQLNKAHKDPSSGNVITLLETMTSSTNILGATFEDLAETIEQIEDKERIGVCLDTCHVFAAGYDLRTREAFNATIDKFDKTIGLKYLKALHMNDSKAPFNSGRDLHANIGTGFLGLRAFHNIVNEPRLWGLPMVLETPIDVKDADTGKEVPDKSIWAREIKLLESLVGMDVDSEAFITKEAELHAIGTTERERIQVQVDKKEAKARNKEGKERAKARNKTGKKTKKELAKASDNEASSSEHSS